VRLARKALDLTQEALADRLGVTFQQLQKYEKGVNRMSASRLHQAAVVLGVPVSFFFPEGAAAPAAGSATDQPLATMEFVNTEEGVELNRAFSQINNAAVRQRVIDLVQSLARSSGPAQRGGRSRRAEVDRDAGSGASPAPPTRLRGKNG